MNAPRSASCSRIASRPARHAGPSASTLLAALALALLGSLLVAAPAQAVSGDHILGHRCRLYDKAVTNENTVVALQDTATIAGASCEIDVWTISDGTVIVWHDSTWGRVADHSTLPDGVEPTDKVRESNWAQVSQIRTKGGEPVPTLDTMIDAAAAKGMRLVVEVRNKIADPGHWVDYAAARSADIGYYKLPNGTECKIYQLDKLRNAGAEIGLKMPSSSTAPCQLTVDGIAAKGASFISEDKSKITAEYVGALHSRGVAVYVRGAGGLTSKALLDKGVDKLLVNKPHDAVKWPE